jgi:hypothetical protein
MANVLDSFREPGKTILLQPNSEDVPYKFAFPACSGGTSNDGAIPYGADITSADVLGSAMDGGECTGMVGTASVEGDVVVVPLTYPDEGAGSYKLTFVLTLSTGAVLEFDFNRITAKDI